MPCIVAILAVLSPRLALIFIAIFTDRFIFAFNNWWIPTLGFLLLPWTTLAWVIFYQAPWGVVGFGWFFVMLGFLIDILSYATSASRRARSA